MQKKVENQKWYLNLYGTDDLKISLRLVYSILELIENQNLYNLKCRNWFKLRFFQNQNIIIIKI